MIWSGAIKRKGQLLHQLTKLYSYLERWKDQEFAGCIFIQHARRSAPPCCFLFCWHSHHLRTVYVENHKDKEIDVFIC